MPYGRPLPSITAWSFVFDPPLRRPVAVEKAPFFAAGAAVDTKKAIGNSQIIY